MVPTAVPAVGRSARTLQRLASVLGVLALAWTLSSTTCAAKSLLVVDAAAGLDGCADGAIPVALTAFEDAEDPCLGESDDAALPPP